MPFLRDDDPTVMAAAGRVVRVVRDLRWRNKIWADDGGDAELPASVTGNPDVAAYDCLDEFAVLYKEMPLERLIATIISEEISKGTTNE